MQHSESLREQVLNEQIDWFRHQLRENFTLGVYDPDSDEEMLATMHLRGYLDS